MSQRIYTAQGLTKTYASGEVHALRGVDVETWSGEVVAPWVSIN